MLDEIKKLTRTIQEKNIFEEVTFYLSREALIQKMQALSPHVAYEFFDESVEKEALIFVLIVVDLKKHRFNLFTESDLETLKDLAQE